MRTSERISKFIFRDKSRGYWLQELSGALDPRANRYKQVVWLIGDGRSGTTWVSNVIAKLGSYRQMFEPIHDPLVRQARFMGWNPYRSPDQDDPRIEAYLGGVFSGRFRQSRVDQGNRWPYYRSLLVKDVQGTLLASWALRRFPFVKPILIVRHPFSVALSKAQLRDWYWTTDPMSFLRDANLTNDHLARYRSVIEDVAAKDDFLLTQILDWCVKYLVAYRTLDPANLHVVFYEDMITRPELEIAAIGAYLGIKGAVSASALEAPSAVSSADSVRRSRSSGGAGWMKQMSPHHIAEGNRILAALGMGGIYDAEGKPVRGGTWTDPSSPQPSPVGGGDEA